MRLIWLAQRSGVPAMTNSSRIRSVSGSSGSGCTCTTPRVTCSALSRRLRLTRACQRASSATRSASAALSVTKTWRWVPTLMFDDVSEQVRIGGADVDEPRDRLEPTGEHVGAVMDRLLYGLAARGVDHDPERNGLLQRPGKDRGGRNAIAFALVAELRLVQRQAENVERLGVALRRALHVDAESFELIFLVAPANADFEPAAAEQVDGGEFFGHDQRMMQRQGNDGGAEPDPVGAGGQVRQQQQRPRRVAVVQEMMLGDPELGKAELFGGLRDLDRPPVDFGRRTRGGRLHQEKYAEVHVRRSIPQALALPCMRWEKFATLPCSAYRCGFCRLSPARKASNPCRPSAYFKSDFSESRSAKRFFKRPNLDITKPKAKDDRGRYDVAVYLCADARYLKFAWVAARSLVHDPRREFDVILVVERDHGVTGLTPPRGCILVEVDAPPVPDGVPMPAHLSPFAFARIAMVDTVLASYRRLIYLDSDVRITGSLSQLCTLDLKGAPIGAVEDCYICRAELAEANQPVVPTVEQHQLSALAAKTGFSERKILAQLSKSLSDQWRDQCARLGIRAGARYFNSGVLVIDTKIWRDTNIPQKINEFVQIHGMLLFSQDQDLLNGVFAGNWAELSPRWNFQTHYFGNGLDGIVHPAIFHYLDKVKPWSPCSWPYEAAHVDAFTQLFSSSPWPDLIQSTRASLPRSVDPICSAAQRVKAQHAELSAIVLRKFAADFAAGRFVDIASHEQRLIADRIEALAGF